MDNDQLFERIKDTLRGKVETFMEKATPLYAALNWEWNINGEKKVPAEEDIMMKLYGLIDALKFNPKGYWTSSNGLKVQYRFVKNGIEISMLFVKEEKDSGIYNF